MQDTHPHDEAHTPARRILRRLIRGMEIDGQWFRHNLGLIAVTALCLIVFVTNRYLADQELIEEDLLKEELADIRYRAVTKSAELTFAKRSSQIEERMRQRGDSTLKMPTDAPFIIKPQPKDEAR